MDKNEAEKILIAVACCSTPGLHCDTDCPRYVDGVCNDWTDEEAVEAVRTLNRKDDAE